MSDRGRPSKYTEKILTDTQSYVLNCWKNNSMPYIEELSLELGINDDTIVEWSKEHQEFSATIKRLKMLQKLHLKKDALERKIHPTMSIFLLKANHGLNEKDPDMEEKEDNNIVVTFYGTKECVEEINELLAKNGAGRIEGQRGNLAYVPKN